MDDSLQIQDRNLKDFNKSHFIPLKVMNNFQNRQDRFKEPRSKVNTAAAR